MMRARCWEVLAFLDKPTHLVGSTLVAVVLVDERFGLNMLVGIEHWTAASAVVSTALALRNGVDCSAVAFETLDDRSPNYG